MKYLCILLACVAHASPALARPRCATGAACLEAGEALQRKMKYSRANEQFERACRKRSAPGCLAAAEIHWQGQGYWPLPRTLTRLYSRACRLDRSACAKRDQLRAFIKGVPRCRTGCPAPRYPTRERWTWDFIHHSMLCKRRVAGACRWLAHKYRDAGTMRGDPTMARKLLRKACRLGEKDACAERRRLEERITCADPAGCAAKIQKAKKAYPRGGLLLRLRENACGKGLADGCTYAGISHQTYRPRVALGYWRRGCKLGDASSCEFYAKLLAKLNPGKRREVMRASTRACTLSTHYCWHHMKRLVEGGKAPVTDLERLGRRSCADKKRFDCNQASRILHKVALKLRQTDPKTALRIMTFACAGYVGPACMELVAPCKDARQCLALADQFRHPRGLHGHVPAAIKLWERACKVFRKYEACLKAALLLQKKDRKRSLALAHYACYNTSTPAVCLPYAGMLRVGSEQWKSTLAITCSQPGGNKACIVLGRHMRRNQRRTTPSKRPPQNTPSKPKMSPAKAKVHAELLELKRQLDSLEQRVAQAKPEYREFVGGSKPYHSTGTLYNKCNRYTGCKRVEKVLIKGNYWKHYMLASEYDRRLTHYKHRLDYYNRMR